MISNKPAEVHVAVIIVDAPPLAPGIRLELSPSTKVEVGGIEVNVEYGMFTSKRTFPPPVAGA